MKTPWGDLVASHGHPREFFSRGQAKVNMSAGEHGTFNSPQSVAAACSPHDSVLNSPPVCQLTLQVPLFAFVDVNCQDDDNMDSNIGAIFSNIYMSQATSSQAPVILLSCKLAYKRSFFITLCNNHFHISLYGFFFCFFFLFLASQSLCWRGKTDYRDAEFEIEYLVNSDSISFQASEYADDYYFIVSEFIINERDKRQYQIAFSSPFYFSFGLATICSFLLWTIRMIHNDLKNKFNLKTQFENGIVR